MVSERQIKTLAAKKKALISDKNFFTSKVLQRYFTELAAMLTQRYGFKLAIKVRLKWLSKNPATGHDPFVAFTDNNTITINCNNELARSCKTREDKLDVIKGLFAHELGHVLFTDFEIMEAFYESISVCKWYPKKPDITDPDFIKNLNEIEVFWAKDPKNIKRFFSVVKHIDNIIEDGYIEQAFMEKYKGNLCEGLYLVRDIHYEQIEKIWELTQKTELDPEDPEYMHPFNAVAQLLLCYAKYGEFKYDDEDELEDEVAQKLLPCLEYVDSALIASNATYRRMHVNEVIVCLWPEIKSYLDWIASRPETESEESGEGGEGSGSGAVEKSLGSTKGTSTSGKGKSRPSDSGKDTENEEAKDKRGKAKKALEGKDEEDEKGEGEGEGEDEKEAEGSGKEGDPNPLVTGEGEGKNTEEIKSGEGGRIEEHDTDSIATAEDFDDGDEHEEEDEYEASEYGGSASDIETLLNEMATEEAEEELEEERLEALNKEGRSLNYGEAHKGMKVDVRRITSVPDSLKEQYNSIAPELCKISKKLQKLISQQLKDKRAGGKMRNLYMGRKLDARTLIRDDGKSFYKKKLPQEAPTLSVGVLLDESGSMSWNSRATYARATAIVLYDFCMGLEIPCCVYGHTADETTYGSLQMHSYAEFDSIDKNDKYRLMDISARSNNRDGAALKFMYDKLDKRLEEVKLLIVVSDGQPAASGYSGSTAETDMKTLKNTYGRKGIITFAAAIGSDKQNIERIYGDGFLDITDLTKLPEILTKLILKYIKV